MTCQRGEIAYKNAAAGLPNVILTCTVGVVVRAPLHTPREPLCKKKLPFRPRLPVVIQNIVSNKHFNHSRDLDKHKFVMSNNILSLVRITFLCEGVVEEFGEV